MSGSTKKNKVKLLLCKFDRGGLCGKGDQNKKNNCFGGLGGQDGLGGLVGRGGRDS